MGKLTKEDFVDAFKYIYRCDELDESFFNKECFVDKIDDIIEDYEFDKTCVSDKMMADDVLKILNMIEYGQEELPDDSPRIIARFPEGRLIHNNMISNQLLTEYKRINERKLTIKSLLFERFKEINTWENENLGCKREVTVNSNWRCKKIEIEEDVAWFTVYETWAYGGYEENEFDIKVEKLISDDWKTIALEEYNKKMEQMKKEKEEDEKRKAESLRKRELAELKRLEEKYYGKK